MLITGWVLVIILWGDGRAIDARIDYVAQSVCLEAAAALRQGVLNSGHSITGELSAVCIPKD